MCVCAHFKISLQGGYLALYYIQSRIWLYYNVHPLIIAWRRPQYARGVVSVCFGKLNQLLEPSLVCVQWIFCFSGKCHTYDHFLVSNHGMALFHTHNIYIIGLLLNKTKANFKLVKTLTPWSHSQLHVYARLVYMCHSQMTSYLKLEDSHSIYRHTYLHSLAAWKL